VAGLIGLLTALIESITTECKLRTRFAQFDHYLDRNDQNGVDSKEKEKEKATSRGAALVKVRESGSAAGG
jgi:hypothetical protein